METPVRKAMDKMTRKSAKNSLGTLQAFSALDRRGNGGQQDAVEFLSYVMQRLCLYEVVEETG